MFSVCSKIRRAQSLGTWVEAYNHRRSAQRHKKSRKKSANFSVRNLTVKIMIFTILDEEHRFYSIFVQTTSKIQYKRWRQTKNSPRGKEHKEQETPKKSEKNQRWHTFLRRTYLGAREENFKKFCFFMKIMKLCVFDESFLSWNLNFEIQKLFSALFPVCTTLSWNYSEI